MWLVCQIGAREHYAIPRALKSQGQLAALVTDFWIPPGSPAGRLPGAQRLADRYHPALRDATVHAPNLRMLAFESLARLRKRPAWDRIIARNDLFQAEAVRFLKRFQAPASSPRDPREPVTVFSYSYAALEIFREAKRRGWRTVLGQIDPGPGEDALVRKLRQENPAWAGAAEASPPPEYWDRWREECELADRIVVNSPWSRDLLLHEGIAASKLEIIPLALDTKATFEPPPSPISHLPSPISHPPSRDPAAPLRFLFLGQAIVRKGIHDLVAAARLLGEGPWRIEVVGPHGPLPADLPPCLRFHGPVPRSEAAACYDRADVFLLPTHSDGFALTQLEAMAQGLPVIATPCCGEVVKDEVNGWVLPAGDPAAWAERIRRISHDPAVLRTMSQAARETAAAFTIDSIARALLKGSLKAV
jgi:glycosyltransferase involved in cell wall biosynthesis